VSPKAESRFEVKMNRSSHDEILRVSEVSRVFRSSARPVTALADVSLTVRAGEFVAITGPSGSGKTTLLNLILGLDRADSGTITIDGRQMAQASSADWTQIRRCCIGAMFQDPNLLPGLTAIENVVIAQLPWRPRQVLAREAAQILDAVGLGGMLHARPERMSGGERQRVGLARALLGGRPLILADEPTGNLDAVTAGGLLDLLRQIGRRNGTTFLVATHDRTIAEAADREVRLAVGNATVAAAPG
jgi:ABC-type lipoprotein export system ATPase subunit